MTSQKISSQSEVHAELSRCHVCNICKRGCICPSPSLLLQSGKSCVELRSVTAHYCLAVGLMMLASVARIRPTGSMYKTRSE